MEENIAIIKQVVVQVATPYSVGTGIVLADQGLIVTSDTLVEGNKEVSISSKTFPVTMVRVLYTDARYDLAFLEMPQPSYFPIIKLNETPLHSGMQVLALGLDTLAKPQIIKSQIVNTEVAVQDVSFIEIADELDTGMTGGGLFMPSGTLIGINTMFQQGGDSHGFALDVRFLKKVLEAYTPHKFQVATYCYTCEDIITEKEVKGDNCPKCDEPILLPSGAEEYEPPLGVTQTVEQLIEKLGYDVALSRRGLHSWSVERGSATIHLTYYEPKGYIMADAFLCKLPPTNPSKIYEFLLKQNSEIKGLSFSVKDMDVVLSLVIYDGNFNDETAAKLIDYLLERADYYDNVLVEEYGALWKE